MSQPDVPMAVGLVFRGDGSSAWEVRATDVAALRDKVGTQTLADVFRCLVWADRVVALAELALFSHLRSDKENARTAIQRDVQAMFWLTCGCLRELSSAVKSLASDNLRARLTPDGAEAWDELARRQVRWDAEPYSGLRNSGFHVFRQLMMNGIDALAAEGKPLNLSEGYGGTVAYGWFPLAHAALGRGAWPEAGRIELDSPLLRQVLEDGSGIGPLIERVLIGLIPELKAPNTT